MLKEDFAKYPSIGLVAHVSKSEHCCAVHESHTTHALLRCKEWGKQRKRLMENLRKREILDLSPRLNGIDTQMLFQGKAAEATLEFLKKTQIGNLQKKEDDEWLDM